jgi:hypothetical protein
MMKRFVVFVLILSIFVIPVVPAYGTKNKSEDELILNLKISGKSKAQADEIVDSTDFIYQCQVVYDASDPENECFTDSNMKSYNYTFTASGGGGVSNVISWKYRQKNNHKIKVPYVYLNRKKGTVEVKGLVLADDSNTHVDVSPPDTGCVPLSWMLFSSVISNDFLDLHKLFEENRSAAIDKLTKDDLFGFMTTNLQKVGNGYRASHNTVLEADSVIGWGKVGNCTIDISYTITKGWSEPDLEVVIIPDSNYPDWIPNVSGDKGYIGFKAVLRKKGKPNEVPTQKARFDFELVDVTKQVGYCLNSPVDSSDEDFDLIINTTGTKLKPDENRQRASTTEMDRSAEVLISCFDWAAYGKLKVTATTDEGQTLTGYLQGNPQITEIKIPLDNNNNKIADAWEKKEKIYSEFVDPSLDDESQEGNNYSGDGYTLFEEYRGIIAKGKHKRLSPTKKDLIIIDLIDADKIKEVKKGIELFERLSGVKITLVNKDEVPASRVVNANESLYRITKQHGVILRNGVADSSSSGVLGIAEPAHVLNKSPKLCTEIIIDVEEIKRIVFPDQYDAKTVESFRESVFACTVAHEIGHVCGLNHHGDKEYGDPGRTRMIYVTGNAEVYDENNVRIMPEQTKPVVIPEPIGAIGGPSSGEVTCIMCYQNLFTFVMHEGSPNKFYKVPYVEPPAISSYTLCRSAKGTGINASTNKPVSYFGDAANRGNCFGNINVRDF